MVTKPKSLLWFALGLSGLVAGCSTGDSPRIPRTTPSSNTVAYSIKNLGTLGGNSGAASAINASGQVVGRAMTAAGVQHAFLYSGDKMHDLGTLPGYACSRATGINASGQVVGWVETSAFEQHHAFIYSGGRMREIGTLGGKTSEAYAINATGDIVGEAETAAGQRHAFLYTGGSMRDLGTSGVAYGLNDAGQVVGSAGTVPFFYDSDKLVLLNMVLLDASEPIQINPPEPSDGWPSPGRAEATAINSAGQIVGFIGNMTPWSSAHAFLYRDGKVQDLGSLGGHAPFCEARAINAQGQIVGMSGSHPIENHGMDGERAFLYSGGQMKDLRQLVGEAALAASGFKALRFATGINDRGQIVGTGSDLKRNHAAFLLNPIRQK
jgi:probable HAF family extracellular repeat protein